jgi:hypothetical protein
MTQRAGGFAIIVRRDRSSKLPLIFFFAALRLGVKAVVLKKQSHAKTRSRKDAQSQTKTTLPNLCLVLRNSIVQGCGWTALDLTANSHCVHALLTLAVHNHGDNPIDQNNFFDRVVI